MKKVQSWWMKFLVHSASAIATIAVFSSQIACSAKYYQPVVPERLRK